MPDHTGSGVYLEETHGPRAITGVWTGTAAFVGPTLSGPGQGPSKVLRSVADFANVYGGSDRLEFVEEDGTTIEVENYVWHAVRAFFEQGGERLYVARALSDGARPTASAYEIAFALLEPLDQVSIVAAPGSTYGYDDDFGPHARQIVEQLLGHAERMKDRFAIVDSGNNQSLTELRTMRGHLNSTYGALYCPWVRVLDPGSQKAIHVPPSGFVAGIYARSDAERGVHKVPANEVVNLALGFEYSFNKAQQDMLNAEGINYFRAFEGRGMRLWGARTLSADPQWKYVNVRRYLTYIERSIETGTKWVVFEPNAEPLWSALRRVIADFLFSEWNKGALLGDKPEDAYFVRCDLTTMSQSDIDNGRVVVVIGVALLQPAEFVIVRIGQWTADAQA